MGDGRDVVTGAFGFTGRAIAERLLAAGRQVTTLTNRPPPPGPLGHQIDVVPLDFERPKALAEALRGATTLYNTRWIRFQRGVLSFERAIAEAVVLFDAALEANVGRVVHISVVNAEAEAPTEYVRAKARLERILAESGLPHAVVRPTLTFGLKDIMINNLAWALRRLPVVGIPGDGLYRLQPVHVDDVARLAVEARSGPVGAIVDAAGPETFTYRELVAVVRTAIGSRARIIHVPPLAMLATSRMLGLVLGDVVLTRDELEELMGSFLVSGGAPTGRIRLTDFVLANKDTLGRRYTSELARNYVRAERRRI